MMRVVSGGIDYAVGLERSIRFGLQEILGVEVDMDYAGLDALKNRLVYLDDSRRDMANIHVPVTWIHGRHDAWMDVARAHDIMSRGDTTQRRFIEVPTGHMLKNSREAIETFQLVVTEISRIALGHAIPPRLPDLADLDRKQRSERSRLASDAPDLREFWRDYLLGTQTDLGIDLMTGISPYRELMGTQIDALQLRPGDRVADMGSGTGPLPIHLSHRKGSSRPIQVLEMDFVRAALKRARDRVGAADGVRVHYVEANLDSREGKLAIPVRSNTLDAVLAGLFLGYVADPSQVLQEIRRALKPGGRLVVSSLTRDPDMSKLHMDGIEELRAGLARQLFGEQRASEIDIAERDYLNQASRLVDLEEQGCFRFWDPEELVQLVRDAGFRRIRTARSFGDPPQAVVVSAEV
jgi:ubiquinone/menaquinone biosynthesis C-methylase UbiE